MYKKYAIAEDFIYKNKINKNFSLIDYWQPAIYAMQK